MGVAVTAAAVTGATGGAAGAGVVAVDAGVLPAPTASVATACPFSAGGSAIAATSEFNFIRTAFRVSTSSTAASRFPAVCAAGAGPTDAAVEAGAVTGAGAVAGTTAAVAAAVAAAAAAAAAAATPAPAPAPLTLGTPGDHAGAFAAGSSGGGTYTAGAGL